MLPRTHLVDRLQKASRHKTKFDLLDHQGCKQQQTENNTVHLQNYLNIKTANFQKFSQRKNKNEIHTI
jgi:hypothetical protein